MNDFESVNIRTIKTIIIGNSGVGKSTFLYRYINGSYNPQEVTLGMDFKSKKI
jgi:GTPase SAR1 family protein